MDRKICGKCDEKILLYPSDFNVMIKQINPIYTLGTRPVIINCIRESCDDLKSYMKIKLKPMHGKVYLIEPNLIIYKARRCFVGMDIFQIFIEDEVGGTHIENILIYVK